MSIRDQVAASEDRPPPDGITQVVEALDGTIANLVGLRNLIAYLGTQQSWPCLHRKRQEVSTMGQEGRTFLCPECGAEWSEPWPE